MILLIHQIVVFTFLLIYVIKTILLLSNKNELLVRFTKKIKIPEMIVSAAFLLTGVYLMTQVSFGGKYDFLFWIKIAMVILSIPIAIIGFKKGNKILAALSLLLITGSYGLAEVYHKKKAEPVQSNSGIVDGKVLYDNNCIICHGGDGKLNASGSKDLSLTLLDKQGLKDVILNPKGLMPKADITEEQANAIAEYVNNTIKGH